MIKWWRRLFCKHKHYETYCFIQDVDMRICSDCDYSELSDCKFENGNYTYNKLK